MSWGALLRKAGLIIWVAYFVVPTDAGGLIGGIPLGPIEAVALLTLAWLAVRDQVPRGAWAIAAILIIATVSAALIPGTGGFRARYFANAEATGPPERSTEFRDSSFTRIDHALDFVPGGPEFPLAFFNDSGRFNFHDPAGPRRRQLAFSAAWTGHWWVAEGARTLYLDAPDASAQLFVDGTRIAAVTPDTDVAEVSLPLTAGWHRLDLNFSSPYGAPRRFSAGEVSNGDRQPFNDAKVVTQRVRPWQVTATRLLRVAKTLGDVLVLAWLAWQFTSSLLRHLSGFRRGVPALRQRALWFPILTIVGAAEALVFAWPWSRQFLVMRGGDDPMTYEWYSRDILFNGILMNGNAPLGEGEPFYYQALYPYFLAAIHALFGEGMFGVVLAQRLLVVFAVWVMVKIAVEIAGEEAWPSTLACGTVFAIWKYWPIAAELPNESLYVPLLVAWAAVLMSACRAPTMRRALDAGVVGALTAMTRSTALLAWPAVFFACWRAWRPAASRRAYIGTLLISSIAVFSLIGVRNWIVAGEWTMTSTGMGVTLLSGNEPPADVTIDLRHRGALYERLGFNEFTAPVVEYAIVAPRAFAMHQGRKALFALGFYEPFAPGWGYSPIYIIGWMLAVVGVVVAIRAGRGSLVTITMPAIIAASQFVAVVAVYPKNERLILPIYALLVPYAGIALAKAAGYVTRR